MSFFPKITDEFMIKFDLISSFPFTNKLSTSKVKSDKWGGVFFNSTQIKSIRQQWHAGIIQLSWNQHETSINNLVLFRLALYMLTIVLTKSALAKPHYSGHWKWVAYFHRFRFDKIQASQLSLETSRFPQVFSKIVKTLSNLFML